ncbi:MAG: RNA polymerase factor sigma-54 [Chitinispirillales bacterium]|nr:RNA polymerase factor sigma-54 [Chitinispirillales bacterium]
MNLNFGIGLSQSLQQKVSFGMIQAMKMLQVNTLQLEQMLRAELEQNPVLDIESETDMELDLDDEYGEEPQAEADKEDEGTEREEELLEELNNGTEDGIDWEEYFEDGFSLGDSYNEETDRGEERYEPSPVYQDNLEKRLLDQLKDKKIEKRIGLLVRFLIGSLDEDGYLRMSDDDIIHFTGATICDVEEALNVLWRFEPAGVGARNLRECMTLQLRARKMQDSLAMRIITECWSLLERLKIPEISRRLNVEPREIQEAMEVIKTLSPKPGYLFDDDKSSVIIPDLIVERVDGKFIVLLNDRNVPSLCINRSYAAMIKRGSKASQEVKDYIRDKFNSATWFIRGIEQRRSTMTKVMYAIIERQKMFFEKGPPHLAPLRQQEISDMISMSKSTVSRVTSNKYVQTLHGIFELKYFFTEAVVGKKEDRNDANDTGDDMNGQAGEDTDVTAGQIKNRIRQLIEDEDSKAPLSDQKIADILGKENLAAARRTVAKYRDQMKILPARMRQKYE